MVALKRGPYRKPGPWQLALRRLHRRGYSDAEIAEKLSDLSDAAIQELEAAGTWGWRAVDRVLVPESGGKPWTRHQVRRHRRQLGLKGNRVRPECGTLALTRLTGQLRYQREHHWGYLLPRYDEDAHEWSFGYELRRRETDILCLLRDRGPMTRAEILAHLKLRGLNTHGRSYLVRLQLAGLIRCEWTGREPGVYRLTEACRPSTEPRRETGVDLFIRRLKLAR